MADAFSNIGPNETGVDKETTEDYTKLYKVRLSAHEQTLNRMFGNEKDYYGKLFKLFKQQLGNEEDARRRAKAVAEHYDEAYKKSLTAKERQAQAVSRQKDLQKRREEIEETHRLKMAMIAQEEEEAIEAAITPYIKSEEELKKMTERQRAEYEEQYAEQLQIATENAKAEADAQRVETSKLHNENLKNIGEEQHLNRLEIEKTATHRLRDVLQERKQQQEHLKDVRKEFEEKQQKMWELEDEADEIAKRDKRRRALENKEKSGKKLTKKEQAELDALKKRQKLDDDRKKELKKELNLVEKALEVAKLNREVAEAENDNIEEEKKQKHEESLADSKKEYQQERSNKLKEMFGFDLSGDWDTESGLKDQLSGITAKMDELVEKASSTLSNYTLKVNTRLQGLDIKSASIFGALATTTFEKIFRTIQSNLAFSPYFKQEDVLSKLAELTDKGIAYNIESRAFLATAAEGIADTFNAMQESLLNIVRIQQQDSTAQRLGMESALTKMLNEYYKDTSYLTDRFDSVADALFEASSKMSRDASVEFEFTVQKWLGAMSSVGVGSSIVNNIAQGLGYLGSGDVTALAGNQSLQTLIAIAANKAGLNYAQMLTEGLDVSTTNKLLEAITEYLIDIAEATEQNNVVQKAYGNVLGLNVSDFQGITNLKSTVESIAQESMTSSQMMKETENSLKTMWQRSSVASMMETLMSNITFSVGAEVAANPILYTFYKGLGLLEGLAGDIELPFITAFGNGIDLGSLVGLIKAGVMGTSVLSTVVKGLTSLGNIFSPNLTKQWNYKDTITYGSGFSLKNAGKSTSQAQMIGNTSSDDMENGAIKDSLAESKEKNEVSGAQETQDEKDVYVALFTQGSKAVLSNMYVHTETINQNVAQIQKAVNSVIGLNKSVNVNLKSVGSIPILDGRVDVKMDALSALVGALSVLTGGQQQNNSPQIQGHTLQELIDLLCEMKSDENDSLNVTILRNKQSLLNWLTQIP